MRETLYIRLGQTDQVTWLLQGDPVQESRGSLAEAAAAASGRQVMVLVPGADVTLASIAVPTRNRRRMAAAVPYLLEEQLAADVDDCHFALGERDAQGKVAVAVVSRMRMEGWLSRLAEAGLHADRVVAETLLLPCADGEWTLLAEQDGVTVRNGAQSGMALDAATCDFVLRRAVEEAETKPALLRVWLAGGVAAAVMPDDLGVPMQTESLEASPLAFLVGRAHDPAVIDLLQGPYSRRERLGKVWRPWRPAAALLAVWVVVQFGINLYQSQQLGAQEVRLRGEVSEIYLQTFPDAKRVVDARVQMEQRLAALRGGTDNAGDFIKMLAAVSGPVAGLGGVDIDHLSYKEGEINLALTISDLQRLEQLKDKLRAEAQLAVEIQSATTRNDKVEARLQIRGGRS